MKKFVLYFGAPILILCSIIVLVIVTSTGNASTEALWDQIDGNVILESYGEWCERQNENCHEFESTFIALNEPVDSAFLQLISNLNSNGFTFAESAKQLNSILAKPEDYLDQDVQDGGASEREARAKEAIFLLGGGIFGEFNFLQKDDEFVFIGQHYYDATADEATNRKYASNNHPIQDEAATKLFNYVSENPNKHILVVSTSY